MTLSEGGKNPETAERTTRSLLLEYLTAAEASMLSSFLNAATCGTIGRINKLNRTANEASSAPIICRPLSDPVFVEFHVLLTSRAQQVSSHKS